MGDPNSRYNYHHSKNYPKGAPSSKLLQRDEHPSQIRGHPYLRCKSPSSNPKGPKIDSHDDKELDARDVAKWIEREGSKAKRLEIENLKLRQEVDKKSEEMSILVLDNEELRKKIQATEEELGEKYTQLQFDYDFVVKKLEEERTQFYESLENKDSLIASLTSTVENLKTTKAMHEKEKNEFLNMRKSMEHQMLEIENELDTLKVESKVVKEEISQQNQELTNLLVESKRNSVKVEHYVAVLREQYEKSLTTMAHSRKRTENVQAALQAFMQEFGVMQDNSNAGEEGEKLIDKMPKTTASETQWKRFFLGEMFKSEDDIGDATLPNDPLLGPSSSGVGVLNHLPHQNSEPCNSKPIALSSPQPINVGFNENISSISDEDELDEVSLGSPLNMNLSNVKHEGQD